MNKWSSLSLMVYYGFICIFKSLFNDKSRIVYINVMKFISESIRQKSSKHPKINIYIKTFDCIFVRTFCNKNSKTTFFFILNILRKSTLFGSKIGFFWPECAKRSDCFFVTRTKLRIIAPSIYFRRYFHDMYFYVCIGSLIGSVKLLTTYNSVEHVRCGLF